jgi:anthranilate synthase component 2
MSLRVLLLDNYDSFAWNLVQALREIGAAVDVRRNDAVSVEEALASAPDAIVLSPGPKGPADAGVSVPLVLAAAARRVPLLGVCLGHQAIGVAFGGRIVASRRLRHGKTSRVVHDGGPEFRGIASPFEAMRYHSLAVAEPLPSCLERTAWTDDDGELMGVRHRELPVVGWQFHPESFLTSSGPRLLSNFLGLAAARARVPEISR